MEEIKKLLKLYLVTDEAACKGRSLYDVVQEAVKGGVTMVQLREKSLGTRAFVERAFHLKALLAPYGIPLIINDRIDVALAVDADGVHIGQSDMPFELLRELLPEGKIIGLSVENQEDVKRAEHLDVSYIAASPLFATLTKTDIETPWGLDGLRWIRENSSHPLAVIGGLNQNNIGEAIAHGADGIALISAICSAENPYSAAREIRQIIDTKLEKP